MAEPGAFLGPVHLVGIGGDGMTAIARYLLDMRVQVTGSDLRVSAELERLTELGATIFSRHAASHCPRDGIVVASDAIPPANVELAEARIRDIPILRRAGFLSQLARSKRAIFVAGAHGKSTTTAMIAKVLDTAGLGPSFIGGADIPSLGGRRARCRPGELLVCEACEAFNNLTPLNPDFAVITNIDDDHLEHFGSQALIDATFRAFAARTSSEGVIFVNGGDPGIVRALVGLRRPVTTFGFGGAHDVGAENFRHVAGHAIFDVSFAGRRAGTIDLPVPGRHSALNALACVSVCLRLGLSFDEIARGLSDFTGVARRWQDHGLVDGIRLVDDYAHHPAELGTAIDTAHSLRAEGQRLIVAFQPQLYSRTRRLGRQFAAALADADLTLLLEVDPSGEAGSDPVSSAVIAAELRKRGCEVRAFDGPADLVDRVGQFVGSGDFLLMAGAGSIRDAAPGVRRRLMEGAPAPRPNFVPSPARRSALATPRHSVLGMFQRQVREAPQDRAVSGAEGHVSFAELDAASDAFLHTLQSHGLTGRQAIGVSLPSSIDLIVAILAITKLGAVYVPIDNSLPRDRADFMLAQAQAAALITSPASPLDRDPLHVPRIHVGGLAASVTRDWKSTLARVLSFPESPAFDSTDRAYICFTSGSTGRPKGVAVAHRALFLLIADIVQRFEAGPGRRVLLNTSVGFDVSLAEIWMSLCSGAELCVTGSARPLVGERLGDCVATRRISHLAITPSVLGSLSYRTLPSLTHIICAGEACPQSLADIWSPGRRFFNAYGPTEATIYATVAECQPGSTVTIGTPLPHVEIFVLDEALTPVAPGTEGELCLVGPALARGYVAEDPQNGGFFQLSLGTRAPVRMYRTGDLVRHGTSGDLEFLGRRDDQIKLLGNRIETGEIEHTARSLDTIKDAAVVLVETGATKELVCFVTLRAGAHFDADEIRTRLAAWLPAYMIPVQIIEIEAIPLTPSGKQDRRQLAQMVTGRPVRRGLFSEGRTDVEQRLRVIWQDILGGEQAVGVYDDFDSLGGDSLKSLMLIAEIEKRFELSVPPGYFERFTTIVNLSIQVEDLLWGAPPLRQSEALGFRATRIYHQLRHLTASWVGARIHEDGLIVSLGDPEPRYELFVCLQSEHELRQLAKHLGEGYRVHGMRSGHLVMSYTPENTNALATHYLEEMSRIALTGHIVIGGVCQGGAIAYSMARALKEAGTPVAPLVLIEQARLAAYEGAIAFFYSNDSYLNPYKRFDTGIARYQDTYADRFTLDILAGDHGQFNVEPYVHEFVAKLRSRIENIRKVPAFFAGGCHNSRSRSSSI